MNNASLTRRHVLRSACSGLVATAVLAAARSASATSICMNARACVWRTGSPPSSTDLLATLGYLMIDVLNQYNVSNSALQLDYWDDQIRWSSRTPAAWAFKGGAFLVGGAMRVPYVGAKDKTLGLAVDEALLVGMAVEDEDRGDLSGGGFTNKGQIMVGNKPVPNTAGTSYQTLAWLTLKTCSPHSTINTELFDQWWVKDTTTWAAPASIPEDKNGAEWLFRGALVRVENSRKIGPLFLRNKAMPTKFHKAWVLVGWEGSGGY